MADSYTIVNFYQFVTLDSVEELRNELEALTSQYQLKGTILLACEGINAMLSGSLQQLHDFIEQLSAFPAFKDLTFKWSQADVLPFHRLKVVIKPEIVSFGVPGVSPAAQVGEYVEPQDWNALIEDPDVVLIDTRNAYEVAMGSFKGAVDPKTTTFREFAARVREDYSQLKGKKIAMCCTGGIRCEKATSFLLQEGFESVYHLKGGILNYLEKVPVEKSLWEGECFVFDSRVAVDHHLQPGSYTLCFGCKLPLSAEDTNSPEYEAEVCCPHCKPKLTPEKRARLLERQKQMQLAAKRQVPHLGAKL